jgi:hypothetical protein
LCAASGVRAMFPKLYLSEHLSDYNIVLIAEDQPEPGPKAKNPDSARVLLGHGAVLMGRSEYFELKLQQPFGKAKTSKTSGKPRLYVQVRARTPPSKHALPSGAERALSLPPAAGPGAVGRVRAAAAVPHLP